MKKEINVLIITDATKGDNIAVIDINRFSTDTLKLMIGDILLSNIDNGILVKPGIR